MDMITLVVSIVVKSIKVHIYASTSLKIRAEYDGGIIREM